MIAVNGAETVMVTARIVRIAQSQGIVIESVRSGGIDTETETETETRAGDPSNQIRDHNEMEKSHTVSAITTNIIMRESKKDEKASFATFFWFPCTEAAISQRITGFFGFFLFFFILKLIARLLFQPASCIAPYCQKRQMPSSIQVWRDIESRLHIPIRVSRLQRSFLSSACHGGAKFYTIEQNLAAAS